MLPTLDGERSLQPVQQAWQWEKQSSVLLVPLPRAQKCRERKFPETECLGGISEGVCV